MGEALESRPNLVVEGVMLKLCYAIPVVCLLVSPLRAQTIEAVGAEKCRSGQGAFSVSFVAPEDAQLEATAKAKGAEGTTDTTRDTASLELDGKACDKGVCSFKSKKGQSYALLAKPLIKGATTVCVTVARP